MTPQIILGHTYILDGKTPVRVLKSLNRSKTTFSIEMPDNSIDTATIERLQVQSVDAASIDTEAGLFDVEPAMHSMPEIDNDWWGVRKFRRMIHELYRPGENLSQQQE